MAAKWGVSAIPPTLPAPAPPGASIAGRAGGAFSGRAPIPACHELSTAPPPIFWRSRNYGIPIRTQGTGTDRGIPFWHASYQVLRPAADNTFAVDRCRLSEVLVDPVAIFFLPGVDVHVLAVDGPPSALLTLT